MDTLRPVGSSWMEKEKDRQVWHEPESKWGWAGAPASVGGCWCPRLGQSWAQKEGPAPWLQSGHAGTPSRPVLGSHIQLGQDTHPKTCLWPPPRGARTQGLTKLHPALATMAPLGQVTIIPWGPHSHLLLPHSSTENPELSWPDSLTSASEPFASLYRVSRILLE